MSAAPLTREEWLELHRLEWRDAIRRKEPQAVCDALELRWLEEKYAVDGLLDFVCSVTPAWMRPNHLRPLAEVIVQTEHGPVRVCISVPPRHGKTDFLLHAAVWYLKRHPTHTVGYTTHTGRVALSKSKYARQIAQRAGLRLARDSQNAGEWRTLEGGGFLAAGREAGWGGFGVNLFILDDLVADRLQAESQTERDNIDDFCRSTAFQRVEPGGSIIVNMTRWHPDDEIGRLVDEGWPYINLPVFDDAGKPLWEERWNREALALRRRDSTDYEWAALFEGRPRQRGGMVFDKPPGRYQRPDVSGAIRVIACDPAATAKTSADRSAIVVGAASIDAEGFMWLDVLDVRTMQVNMPTLVGELLSVQRTWRAPIVVEAVAGFKGVPDTIKSLEHNLDVSEIQPVGDKFTRAQRVAAAWNDGRVRVPMDSPWVDDFTREVMKFVGVKDARDDQVDALAHCWNTAEKLLQVRDLDDVAAELASGLPHGGF